jgi:hypothetical protein
MREDNAIAPVRKVRHDISAEHNHQPKAYVAYLIERQKRHADRLVKPVGPTASQERP